MSVKILYIIESLATGGAERQLVELVKGLNSNSGNCFEIHICCFQKMNDGYHSTINNLGVTAICFERHARFDLSPIFFIINYIIKFDIDVVHTFLTMASLFGMLAAKLTSTPVICSGIRDSKDENWRVYINIRLQALFADILVSNSSAGFKNRFGKMRHHFKVVYNGMDFSRFDVTDDLINLVRKEFSCERFTHIIGMVARFTNHKDYDTLLDSIPMVLERYPNTGFLLVGDGPTRPTMESKAKTLGIEENLIFTGFRGDVECLYRLMDVSVLLTRSDKILEGISNSLLEAMASGVPVIASAGGGTDELIEDGINGYLIHGRDPVKTGAAIIRVLSNKEKAARIAVKACEDVRQRFGLERYVDEYLSLYRLFVDC